MKRSEISKKHKWRLEDIYRTTEDWEADLLRVKVLVENIFETDRFESKDDCLSVLKAEEEVNRLVEKLYVFARMRRDEDNTNAAAQGMADRAMSLYTETSSKLAFIVPAIIGTGKETVLSWCADAEMQLYTWYMKEIFRCEEHTLSHDQETLLAMTGDMAGAAKNIFGMFNNADIEFGKIPNESKEPVELTKGNYTKFLESGDREVRETAFRKLYGKYKEFNNTLAAAQIANIKKDIFYTKARKYTCCLNRALDADNVPDEVYNNLIDTVKKNCGLLQDYTALRKKVLNIDELHMWDLYVPLVEEHKINYAYEEACEAVMSGLSILGEEYREILAQGFKNGWIDVYETEGKTSGAYSWGAYDVHPYVLLNYQGKLNDVFTIAHEMGHAIHSYLSNRSQPYLYAEYKIFVAEVASTVNEILLMKNMLKDVQDPNARAYLLNHYLEEFRGTVFRQTMFAEYEREVHRMAEAGEALTSEALNELYYGLNQDYYGAGVNIDEEIQYEWSRIPHFYNSFYVYKYATGFSAASAIAKMIIEEGEPAVKRYMEFLSGGGSDYPLELLKKAGVDLTAPAPVEEALAIFKETSDELAQLFAAKF